jgi:predicted ATPase/DNA-binding winged helix-turn-helix (wHTH) protein
MIQIGRLSVQLATRQVYLEGNRVQIGSRAFDILELLIGANGDLVKKEDLLNRVWPESFVEENNIQVQISALRRLLGDDRELIKTVPGRGYRLDVQAVVADSDKVSNASDERGCGDVAVPTNLPASTSVLIGREEAIDDVSQMLQTARMLTLAGSGGIGKTRLAIEVARGLFGRFPDGVYLVSLASATDRKTVLQAVGKALQPKLANAPASLEDITTEVGQRRVLVVLDNCEHVLDSAAELAQTLLHGNPGTHLLAASREALRVPGETVYTVATLGVPDHDAQSHEVLECSAVKLFLSRARALNPCFSCDEQSILLTGTVCRRLDGIALAIELAAARAVVLGIQTLEAHLDDRFRVLTGGHRTALPRHQTLKATLDWSYALLDGDEQVLLRRLGIFVNAFTMAAVVAVVGDEWRKQGKAINALAGLIAKSLVLVDSAVQERRYRLLETTRAYALEKLDDYGEHTLSAMHHAQHLCNLLNTHHAWHLPKSSDGSALDLRDDLDDIRAALRWAFSPTGDERIGIALAERAAYYFFDASLVEECCEWSQRALLSPLASAQEAPPDVRMRLLAAHAAGLIYIHGPDLRTRNIWSEVLSMAISLENHDFEARALWGLWNAAQYAGEVDHAIGYAVRFAALAAETEDVTNVILSDRLLGISMHYAGRQEEALAHLERMLEHYDGLRHRLVMLGSSIDHNIVARATLARILWTTGEQQQAFVVSEQALLAARADQHEMAVCYVLVEATIPLALLTGERERAKAGIAALQAIAARAGLGIWKVCCRCYEEYLASETDSSPARLVAFRRALTCLEEIGFRAHCSMLYGQYAVALAKGGCITEAITVVERALVRCDGLGERWYRGELLCIRDRIRLRALDCA